VSTPDLKPIWEVKASDLDHHLCFSQHDQLVSWDHDHLQVFSADNGQRLHSAKFSDLCDDVVRCEWPLVWTATNNADGCLLERINLETQERKLLSLLYGGIFQQDTPYRNCVFFLLPNELFAVHIKTGKTLWRAPIPDNLFHPPHPSDDDDPVFHFADSDDLLWCTTEGQCYFLDAKTGQVSQTLKFPLQPAKLAFSQAMLMAVYANRPRIAHIYDFSAGVVEELRLGQQQRAAVLLRIWMHSSV